LDSIELLVFLVALIGFVALETLGFIAFEELDE